MVVNQVDLSLFYRRQRTRNDDRIVLIFPGTFQWHQGLHIAIEALSHLKDEVPNLELHLYGGGGGKNMQAHLEGVAARLGVSHMLKFCGGAKLRDIPQLIANADIGVVPKRADSFGNEAYSTKIMEFMAQGIPVVVSRTRIDSYYFDDNSVRFFPSGDARAMAQAILDVIRDPELRERLIQAGLDYVQRNNWDRSRNDYLDLVDSLTTETFEGVTAARRKQYPAEEMGTSGVKQC